MTYIASCVTGEGVVLATSVVVTDDETVDVWIGRPYDEECDDEIMFPLGDIDAVVRMLQETRTRHVASTSGAGE